MLNLTSINNRTVTFQSINKGVAEEPLSKDNNSVKEEGVTTSRRDLEQGKLSLEAQRIVAQMKVDENKIKAHEMAHKSVGGQYAGGISYDYKEGPDGYQYIVGGEVPIHASEGRTPDETVRIFDQVRRAALAPSDLSPQDLRVAASASMKIIKAQQEAGEAKQQEEPLNYQKVTENYQIHLNMLKDKQSTIFDISA